jgi:predicted TPR repeat methyltransferase
VLTAEPGYVHAYEGFARAACRAGKLEEAATLFRRLLAFDPENSVAHHLLAACVADPQYDKASEAYIRRLFDHYAAQFDESLAHLEYRAPALIAEWLAQVATPNGSLVVLDAGCGTGLCAPLLKPFASRLVGADLSAGMLKEAAKRGLYDELIESELGAYMAAHPSTFDVVVCCDTLVYVGKLEDTVAAAARTLRPGGRLLFTVEQLTGGDENYRLAPTGRFCHSAAYLHETLTNAGLIDVAIEPITPRREYGDPVDGLMVIARVGPGPSSCAECSRSWS